MYQLKNLTPPQIARLDEVPIARQEQIIEKTGEPLKLLTAYYLVKNASADFSKAHDAAERLDQAMYTLLARKGFWDGTMQVSKPEPAQEYQQSGHMVKPQPEQKVFVVSVPKHTDTKVEKIKPFSISNYPHAKKFMPLHQQQALKGFKEEREAILNEVEKMLAGIPKLRSQAQSELMEQTVHAHYFYGQSDWFILEYSSTDDLFYGYTILNGDSQMAESGYISRQELTENGRVELDFYWKPAALAEALHKADPEYFPAPGKKEKEVTTEDLVGIGLDQKSKYPLAIWRQALQVMQWLVSNTPFVVPYDFGPGKGKYKRTRDVSIVYLAGLFDRKMVVPSPRFKKGDTAQYNFELVSILDDGTFDTVAKEWIYLAKADSWPEPDNVGERRLQIAVTDWSEFEIGRIYHHPQSGKDFEFAGLVSVGDHELATWKSYGIATGAPVPNLPNYFRAKDNKQDVRLRLAQAKAKAQAARIRILKLKSQKAA